MAHISQRAENWNAWIVVNLGERVDAFNFAETTSFLDSLIAPGSLVTLDVKQTRFLSLATFKYLSALSWKLDECGGRLAVLGATEKLKHQMALFSSIEKMLIVKRREQLPPVGLISESPRPDETLGF